MATADKLQKLLETKEAIRQAIVNKGVEVGDDTVFADYANKISEIEAGSGGGESIYYWPEFFERRSRNANYLFASMNILDTETRYKELIENCDVSKSMGFMGTFENFCSGSGHIKELDLTKWNVSKGITFLNMFDGCNLDYLDISGWDFSRASGSYTQIFNGVNIKEINMANCNISDLTNHYRLCYQASGLVTINITGCDTSKATNMNGMFSYCSGLTTIIGEIDASNLTNGFYPSSSNNTFNSCTSLETLYLKNIYKDVTLTNASKWSINLSDTKVKDECLVYIINELPNLYDKGLTATDKIVFTLPPTNTLTAEQVQVAIDKGWQVANTTY